MPMISTARIDLYVEQQGRGDPLLFISGSGGDLRNKPNQFDSPLTGYFNLIGYDQRGLGRSAKPEVEYTMADYADDAAALLDSLEIDAVAVMGVSFGGMVAQEFALRHPQRVKAMVLACTSSGGAGGASYPLHELQHLEPRERAVAHLRVADLMHTESWIRENPEKWEKRITMSMTARPDSQAPAGAQRQLEARRHHDTFDRLGQIKMPVLLAGGRRDGIAPVENMQALHGQISGSTLRLFDGGHMFLLQDKHAYPEIIQWLRLACQV